MFGILVAALRPHLLLWMEVLILNITNYDLWSKSYSLKTKVAHLSLSIQIVVKELTYVIFIYIRSDDHVIAEWRHDEFWERWWAKPCMVIIMVGYLALQRNYNIIIIKLKRISQTLKKKSLTLRKMVRQD